MDVEGSVAGQVGNGANVLGSPRDPPRSGQVRGQISPHGDNGAGPRNLAGRGRG